MPDKEIHFQASLFIIFRTLGFDCRSEHQIATGRLDMVLNAGPYVYCFEFKLNHSAQSAMEQIESKDYAYPLDVKGKQLFKIGVSFSSETRNVVDWLIE